MNETLPDNCPFCGAAYHGEGKTDQWEWVQYKCSTEFENGEWIQDDDCKIAALTQRAEKAETRIKEYREKIEELETDKAMYREKWLNALERVIAAESELKRLREGIEAYVEEYLANGYHRIGPEAAATKLRALLSPPTPQGEEVRDGE